MKIRIAVVAALCTTTCSPNFAGAQEYPKLALRFPHFVTQALPGATVDQWFSDELAKRTGGNIKMQIYWSESMGKATELLRMAAQGGADLTATAAGYFPSQIPALAAASMPIAKSAKQAKLAWTQLYNEQAFLQEEAASLGVHPILWHPIPPYHLICRMPVKTLEDLKGKKIRSWGEDFPRVWQAVGASPVTVLPGEWYESLQRGSIDCMMHSWDIIAAYKLYEVAKYASTINIGATISWPQWWNQKRWASLPENVKRLIVDLAAEADKIEIERLNEATKSAVDTMKASGVQFIDFADADKFEKLKPDFIADWVVKMEKLGKGAQAATAAKRWRELLRDTE